VARRAITSAQVVDLLRRWLRGESLRAIARATGLDRKTVRRYVLVAHSVRLSASSIVDDDTVAAIVHVVQHPPPAVTEKQHALTSHAERIRACLAARVRLSRIHALLAREGLDVSYATLRRFAQKELGLGKRARAA
jgi:hypothetical protein